MGVPDRILLKPGKLSPEEFEVMKTHTLIGERTLRSALLQHPGNLFLHMGMAIARSHHERWDGSGYPDGLTGEEIPLVARIMAVADVYDALRSRRTYKASLSHEESGFLVQEGSGDLFDPSVVAAFREAEARFREVSEEEGEPE